MNNLFLWMIILIILALIGGLFPLWKKQDKQKRMLLLSIVLSFSIFIITFITYFFLGGYQGMNQWKAQSTNQQSTQAFMKQFKNPQEVLAKMQQVVAQHSTDPKGWILLARLQSSLGKTNDAVVSFARANQLEPNNPEIAMQYAQALFDQNDHQLNAKSKALLQHVMVLAPNNPEPINLLALNEFYAKHYQAAINEWQSILQHYSLNSEDATTIRETIEKTQALMNPPKQK